MRTQQLLVPSPPQPPVVVKSVQPQISSQLAQHYQNNPSPPTSNKQI